jgi:hypothetical protein
MGNVLNYLKSLFWKQEMELSLVGLQASGKSTLVQVFATGQFAEDMIPTVGFNMKKVTKGNTHIKFWDIGGQPRFRSMWERYCRGVNSIVCVGFAICGLLQTKKFQFKPQPISRGVIPLPHLILMLDGTTYQCWIFLHAAPTTTSFLGANCHVLCCSTLEWYQSRLR